MTYVVEHNDNNYIAHTLWDRGASYSSPTPASFVVYNVGF
jgi:hypothetical protein